MNKILGVYNVTAFDSVEILEVDGEWKVLDIEINNELNPRQIKPE